MRSPSFSVEERFEVVSLDVQEYRTAIPDAATAGIVGGTIYDALLGRCALKARATRIYTWGRLLIFGGSVRKLPKKCELI